MNRSYHSLRLGLAVTFVWIGIFILSDPAGWAGFIRPWAHALIPFSPEVFMRIVGAGDIVFGALFLLDILPRLSAWLAAAHFAGILVVSGIDGVTVRDIGLLGAALALAFWPRKDERITASFKPSGTANKE